MAPIGPAIKIWEVPAPIDVPAPKEAPMPKPIKEPVRV